MIETFKKKLQTLKIEYNAKCWNCEKANKRIEKIVYTCLDFACATLVHRTMLSPFYKYCFKLVPMRLNKWLGINVCPNVV